MFTPGHVVSCTVHSKRSAAGQSLLKSQRRYATTAWPNRSQFERAEY